MAPLKLEDSLLVLFASAGVGTDAPSFVLTPHGIVPLPGWGIDIIADLTAAANLHAQASQFKGSATVKRELEGLANKIVQGHAEDIRAYSRQMAGAKAEGAAA